MQPKLQKLETRRGEVEGSMRAGWTPRRHEPDVAAGSVALRLLRGHRRQQSGRAGGLEGAAAESTAATCGEAGLRAPAARSGIESLLAQLALIRLIASGRCISEGRSGTFAPGGQDRARESDLEIGPSQNEWRQSLCQSNSRCSNQTPVVSLLLAGGRGRCALGCSPGQLETAVFRGGYPAEDARIVTG